MRKGKFISIKYARRYIYANFGTFFSATQYTSSCRASQLSTVNQITTPCTHHDCESLTSRLTPRSHNLFTLKLKTGTLVTPALGTFLG